MVRTIFPISIVIFFMLSFAGYAMEEAPKKPLYRCAVVIINEPQEGNFYQAFSTQNARLVFPSFDRGQSEIKTEAKKFLSSSLKIKAEEKDIHQLFYFEALENGRKIITDVVAIFVNASNENLTWGAMGESKFFFPEENTMSLPIHNLAFVQNLQLVILHGLKGGSCDDKITQRFKLAIKAHGEVSTGFFACELSAFTEYVKARKKNAKAGCIIS